jgi:endonuclease YncB( thermonuclease family)
MGVGAATYLVAVLMLASTLWSATSSGDEPESDEPMVDASVTRVIDGSSLDAHVDGKRTALGYLGVDVPGLHQPCGQEAFNRNRELVGSRVRLEEDASYQFDEIGRRLYYVFTADGQSIEETLVREGLAHAVRTDGHRGAVLVALQAEAEAAGRGCLWDKTASTE